MSWSLHVVAEPDGFGFGLFNGALWEAVSAEHALSGEDALDHFLRAVFEGTDNAEQLVGESARLHGPGLAGLFEERSGFLGILMEAGAGEQGEPDGCVAGVWAAVFDGGEESLSGLEVLLGDCGDGGVVEGLVIGGGEAACEGLLAGGADDGNGALNEILCDQGGLAVVGVEDSGPQGCAGLHSRGLGEGLERLFGKGVISLEDLCEDEPLA